MNYIYKNQTLQMMLQTNKQTFKHLEALPPPAKTVDLQGIPSMKCQEMGDVASAPPLRALSSG